MKAKTSIFTPEVLNKFFEIKDLGTAKTEFSNFVNQSRIPGGEKFKMIAQANMIQSIEKFWQFVTNLQMKKIGLGVYGNRNDF